MIPIKRSIAIIPARGGSKRIPKKNIKEFFGKPLIAYSIELAIKSKLFDKIIVSTDDLEIKAISEEYGAIVPFLRPLELSDDYSSSGDAVKHTIDYLEQNNEVFDYVCTIYATAPLLQQEYLLQGYKEIKKNNCAMTFSVTSMPFPIQRTFKINEDGRCQMFTPKHFQTRSQDLEEAYQDAGQFYWENVNIKMKDIPFGKDSIPIILPRYLVQDIDTLEDWKRAELMYQNIKKTKLASIKNILIRANSSSIIGTGHIMRDLVLAKQYKNDNIIFACENLLGNINNKILDENYKLEILKNNQLKEIDALIKKLNIDMLIIDNYDINYNFEKKLKKLNPNLIIYCLDDTYEKHYCDILLNHNISANIKKYKNLLPNHCDIRCGSKYTLLRDEFIKEQKKNKKNSVKIKVLIAMGGADTSNINIEILKIFEELKNKNVIIHLITTNANKNINELKKYCTNKSWLTLHINSNQVAKLIRKSTFAIITPSVILNEVYFMEIPFISIKTAKNQKYNHIFLKENNFISMNKFNKKTLFEHIKNAIKKNTNANN